MLDVPVRAGSDDAEERSSSTSVTGGDMELVVDGTSVQTDGLRFTGVTVPRGATITNAYVQFQADEAGSVATNLTVAGQAADNPPGFTTAAGNVSAPAADDRGRRMGPGRLGEPVRAARPSGRRTWLPWCRRSSPGPAGRAATRWCSW